MKKIILLALTAFMVVGCTDKSVADSCDTIVVDSCEYIYKHVPTTGGGYAVMTHKGNCRFCKERRKQELKELVEQLKK